MKNTEKMKNTKKTRIILICVCSVLAAALLIVGGIFGIPAAIKSHRAYVAHHVDPLTEKDLESIDFQRARKLMIVAHPDDDMLWGGAHLLEGGYLVVCITNGRNETRSQEFRRVTEASGNQGLILEYPDKVNGKRDEWKEVWDAISADLTLLLNANDWELIVTHNEKGEYGHQHHKMTHQLVVDSYKSENSGAALYFFAVYHKAVTVEKYESGEEEFPPDMPERLSDEIIEQKRKILKLYKSQEKTLDRFQHMVPYENWIPYEE